MTEPELAMTPNPRLARWGLALLLLLALVLAVRLSLTEVLRETLAQKQMHLLARADPARFVDLPVVGPAVTVGFATLTLLIAAAAAALGAAAGTLSLSRSLRWVLIAAIAALGLCSAFAAANRFSALVGLSDLITALAAGWTVGLLCHPALAGVRGKRLLVALVAAILAAWVAKGLLQYFIDNPETLITFLKDRDNLLRQQGITPGSAGAIAYENRIRAAEITGFLSLSNVTAAGLVGLITLFTGLLATLLTRRSSAPPTRGEIAPRTLYLVGATLLLLASVFVLLFTHSSGGMAMGALCSLAVLLGAFMRGHLDRLRRPIIITTTLLLVLGAAGVLSYGLAFDRLPGKSLTFRWYYWTAAEKLMAQHPLLGVGLHNFGSYYTSVKRPAAPEDVSDPHSFVVRIATELGLPALLLALVLLFWAMLAAARRHRNITLPPPRPLNTVNVTILAIAFALAWWLAAYLLAGPYDTYDLLLAILYAALAAGAGVATFLILEAELPAAPAAMSLLSIAALLGALGMFIYDQINMALVTGAVAMLFRVLIGFRGDDAPPGSPRRAAYLVPLFTGGAALALGGLVWFPLTQGKMAWDPAPAEYRFLEARTHDPAAAEAALNDALSKNPRSIELLMQRIALRRELHQPLADALRQVLSLDRANAQIRVTLALPDSDLPAAERARALWEALDFDAQLAADEPKRLSPAERRRVQSVATSLDPQGLQKPHA